MASPWNPPPPQNDTLFAWAKEHHPDAVRAFLGSTVKPVGFPAGSVFSRIVTRGHNAAVTPWLGVPDETLELIARSEASGSDMAKLLRARFGLQDRYNPMPNMVLRITLTEPRWGLLGRVGPMQTREHGPANVVFIGGATQAWVPGISPTGATVGVLWR